MTNVAAYTRFRNGNEEQVREHQRNAAGFSERSSAPYRQVTGTDAVAAAKARLAAKGYIIE